MLFCTQLAPARHVIQVGEKISTSRVWPSARLNSDLRVEMAFSAMTPPGREVAAGRAGAVETPGADVPGAGVPGAVDAGDEEHETIRRPDTATITAVIAARAGRDPLALGHALPIAALFPAHVQHVTGPARRIPNKPLAHAK
jgi:hypothetical protein